jgi:maltose alpha-D-glucosyltransferase/alpha-amylase
MHQARERGLRVGMDLAIDHTSVEHPWFQAARRERGSPWRDWYVWREDKPADAEPGWDLPGARGAAWRWDEAAQSHYFHRGPGHRAGLNLAHPGVQCEIEKTTAFWLALGVSGFGVDGWLCLRALPGLPQGQRRRDAIELLRALRRHVSTLRGDACLLAEAVPQDDGDGAPAQLSVDGRLSQHLFLALARGDARPLRQAWQALPALPAGCRWAHGLRNHDELDLGQLGEQERQEVLAAFGPETDMQLHGRGLRRRLAPMLGNDARRLAQAHSLLLTLPGTPVLRYGDEIGMGEDLSLAGRDSLRTPMQWSDAAHGGFSRAAAPPPALPVISDSEFGYERVNVEAQRADPESLLNLVERMLRLRRANPAFGLGRCEFLDLGAPALLALRCEHQGQVLYALHNLGAPPLELALPPCEAGCGLHDLLEGRALAPRDDGSCWLTVEPYGYHWLRRE